MEVVLGVVVGFSCCSVDQSQKYWHDRLDSDAEKLKLTARKLPQSNRAPAPTPIYKLLALLLACFDLGFSSAVLKEVSDEL
jgi:hypothetical protein